MFPHRIALIAMMVLAIFTAIGPAQAQQGRGCANDRYGNPQCPPPGGRCMADLTGDIRC